jgi:hypothetical protein
MAVALALSFTALVSAADAAKAKDDDPAAAEDAKDTGKKSKEPAGPKVTLLDKGELRADPSDEGKVLKKLHKKEKLEFVERVADGKWAKVRRGKVEGFVQTELLDGMPPAPAPVEAPAQVAATETKPAEPAKPPEPPPPPKPIEPPAPPPELKKAEATPPEPPARPPLSGLWISLGAGVSLIDSSMAGTTQSGLVPELYNYSISALPALGAQASLGYTFAYKALRIGLDGGYRFAGATSIVVQLPNRDSVPYTGAGGATMTQVLMTPRQVIPTTGHDADVSLSVGGCLSLPKQLDLSLRARTGFQMFGFLPEFNNATPLPQEFYYGPHVGAVVELASRFMPGFNVRLNGGYIPYAVRQENAGLRDGTEDSSNGYYFGASAAVRILRGFDVEINYRLLSTSTSYLAGSYPERLTRDRDPTIAARAKAMMEVLADGATRSTQQQTITLGLVFFRQ